MCAQNLSRYLPLSDPFSESINACRYRMSSIANRDWCRAFRGGL